MSEEERRRKIIIDSMLIMACAHVSSLTASGDLVNKQTLNELIDLETSLLAEIFTRVNTTYQEEIAASLLAAGMVVRIKDGRFTIQRQESLDNSI